MIDELQIARRRAWLPKENGGLGFPYLSSALFAVAWHEVEDLPCNAPMAVDKHWRGYYVRKRFLAMTPKDQATAFIHEVSHLIRRHHDRQQERTANTWFLCCDLEINDDLQFERFPAAIPQAFKLPPHLSAEEYYAKVPPMKTITLHCGSCVGGEAQPYELPQKGEAKGLSKQEAELVRRQVAHDIKDAVRDRGDVAEWAEDWANTELEPKLPWHALLRRFMQNTLRPSTGCIDYTYRRPSRRQWHPFVLPKMIGGTAKAVLVVDTSGSMDDNLVGKAIGEVKGVGRVLGNDTVVLHTDSEVAKRESVDQLMSRRQIHGRGGTDMGVGIEAALEERPDVIVVLTDGYTPWPEEAPEKPVIICLITEELGYDEWATPEWAQVVHVW